MRRSRFGRACPRSGTCTFDAQSRSRGSLASRQRFASFLFGLTQESQPSRAPRAQSETGKTGVVANRSPEWTGGGSPGGRGKAGRVGREIRMKRRCGQARVHSVAYAMQSMCVQRAKDVCTPPRSLACSRIGGSSQALHPPRGGTSPARRPGDEPARRPRRDGAAPAPPHHRHEEAAQDRLRRDRVEVTRAPRARASPSFSFSFREKKGVEGVSESRSFSRGAARGDPL
jgi:hypothetical protein